MPHLVPLTFARPLPGKPGPQALPPLDDAPDTRPRVRQAGGAGGAGDKAGQGWYDAYNALRRRQGKHPDVQAQPALQLERAASTLRKEVRAAAGRAPAFCGQLDTELGQQTFAGINHARRVSASPDARSYADLDARERASYLASGVAQVCAEGYGLRPVAWKPRDAIDVLAEQVAAHGPLAAAGRFGHAGTAAPAVPRPERVADFEVTEWPVDADRPGAACAADVVLLVGCQQRVGEAGEVYLVDPRDGSGGASLLPPRIYAMPYASFVARCSERVLPSGSSPSPLGYLLAGPVPRPLRSKSPQAD